ncbi:MAG: iron ABC transporter permease [Tissierellia bacterium]|jgi:iron complex transport system permease protein|nr:iron ABC transporter permease [Tissierellia bacterium]
MVSVKRKKQTGSWMIVGLFFLVFMASLLIGSERIPINQLLAMVGLHDEPVNPVYYQILVQLRLPRALAAGLIGMALANSGVVFQTCFRNPLADPYMLGISSGAALGASISFVIPGLGPAWTGLFAFVGALGALAFIYTIGWMNGKLDSTVLILSGIAVGFFLSAVVSLLAALHQERMEQIIFWTMGSLNAIRFSQVRMIIIPVLASLMIFFYHWKDLNLMVLGEEGAITTGTNAPRVSKILLVIASLSTAFVVSVSGIIGFVGLVIPHLVRLAIGPNHRSLLPISAFAGATFLMLSDVIARTIVAPRQLPIGIITAFLGSPYFIYLIIGLKRRQS